MGGSYRLPPSFPLPGDSFRAPEHLRVMNCVNTSPCPPHSSYCIRPHRMPAGNPLRRRSDDQGRVAGSSQAVAPVPVGAASGAAAAAVKSIHSPGIVATDEQLAAGQCSAKVVDAATGEYLPDPACTPGAADPAVTQENIDSTICMSGYTATVRPPASNTDKVKAESLREYGQIAVKTTEYDHLISLELGGTNSVSNLWPEPEQGERHGHHEPERRGGEHSAQGHLHSQGHPVSCPECDRPQLGHRAQRPRFVAAQTADSDDQGQQLGYSHPMLSMRRFTCPRPGSGREGSEARA